MAFEQISRNTYRQNRKEDGLWPEKERKILKEPGKNAGGKCFPAGAKNGGGGTIEADPAPHPGGSAGGIKGRIDELRSMGTQELLEEKFRLFGEEDLPF